MLFNAFPMLSHVLPKRRAKAGTRWLAARQRCTTEFYNGAQARAKNGPRWHAAAPQRYTTEFTLSAPTWRGHWHPGAWGGVPTDTRSPHPCARSPKRARTFLEPCLSTAGHALRRKTHSRMLRTRFHEIICDSTP